MPDPQKQTLAQMVKAKYPGVYDDLSDADLETKVKAKYPGVYDDLPTTQTRSAKPQTPGLTTRLGDVMRQSWVTSGGSPEALDVLTGAAKGAGSTVLGAAQLINRGTAAVGLSDPVKPEVWDAARQTFTTPTTPAQSMGKTTEQIGEFFLPAAGVTKLKTAWQTGRGLLDAMISAGLEGTSAGTVQSAQRGTTEGAASTGALAAGATIAAPQVGKALQWTGERIERALVKATKADVADGFTPANVFKYNLGGSISQTFDKATTTLKDLAAQLKAALTTPGVTAKPVDVLGALAEAEQELTANAARTIGRNVNIHAAIEKIVNDPAFLALKNGQADLLTANEIKQAMGELGAWAHGARDVDANAMEMVANAFYSKLRSAVEQAAPAGPTRIASINRQMSEIIPVRNAIIRRIPVEQRQNVLNLGDIIGVSTGSIGLALLNRLLKSGQAANQFVGAGTALAANPTALAQGAAGVTSQVRR